MDKDTEGLMLLTNDGELAHKLISPKKDVEKQMQLNDSDGLESKTECRCEKTRKHPLL